MHIQISSYHHSIKKAYTKYQPKTKTRHKDLKHAYFKHSHWVTLTIHPSFDLRNTCSTLPVEILMQTWEINIFETLKSTKKIHSIYI